VLEQGANDLNMVQLMPLSLALLKFISGASLTRLNGCCRRRRRCCCCCCCL